MKVLLLGNGINRLSRGKDYSWSAVLCKVFREDADDTSCGRGDNSVPLTLEYERLLANGNTGNDNAHMEKELKEKLSRTIKSFSDVDVYDEIRGIDFDGYMTTNYDMTLAQMLGDVGKGIRDNSEQRFSVHRYVELENGKRIWHIHGVRDCPCSIMLGYDHYCRYLRTIESYYAGKYKFHGVQFPSIESKLDRDNPVIKSWIDLFFFSDIYILGLGLGYEEIDLWWLLCQRKRLMNKHKNVRNKILYYDAGNVSGKHDLLRALGVKVQIMNGGSGTAGIEWWAHAYRMALRNIRESLGRVQVPGNYKID